MQNLDVVLARILQIAIVVVLIVLAVANQAGWFLFDHSNWPRW